MKKKKDEITIRSSAAEYLTYVASVGDQQDSIDMRYEDENIWLTQKMMATLYDVGTNTINYHIKKIFEDSELQEDSVIRKFRITAPDGKSYNTNHYSLEMIIAVGFKVNSERAVQFRKWVNQIAKDYTCLLYTSKTRRNTAMYVNMMQKLQQITGPVSYTHLDVYKRQVDVHVRRLREKIEANPSEPKYVHTKWGVGYYYQS